MALDGQQSTCIWWRGMALDASWKYPENKSKARDMPQKSWVVVLFAWVVSRARAFGGEETPAVFGD